MRRTTLPNASFHPSTHRELVRHEQAVQYALARGKSKSFAQAFAQWYTSHRRDKVSSSKAREYAWAQAAQDTSESATVYSPAQVIHDLRHNIDTSRHLARYERDRAMEYPASSEWRDIGLRRAKEHEEEAKAMEVRLRQLTRG